jgi:hypothetical protein
VKNGEHLRMTAVGLDGGRAVARPVALPTLQTGHRGKKEPSAIIEGTRRGVRPKVPELPARTGHSCEKRPVKPLK